MKTRTIIDLPHIANIRTAAIPVLERGHAVTVSGAAGTGVRTCCSAIISLWKEMELGRVFRTTIFPGSDSLKLAQHMAGCILGDQMPGDIRVHCASTLWDLVAKKISKSDISLIVIDRGDLAPAEFSDALNMLSSLCAQENHTLGILIGLRLDGKQRDFWTKISEMPHVALSAEIEPLSPELSLAVLEALSADVTPLKTGVEQEDATATSALRVLGRKSGGNFLRLTQFAAFLADKNLALPADSATIEDLWGSAFCLA